MKIPEMFKKTKTWICSIWKKKSNEEWVRARYGPAHTEELLSFLKNSPADPEKEGADLHRVMYGMMDLLQNGFEAGVEKCFSRWQIVYILARARARSMDEKEATNDPV